MEQEEELKNAGVLQLKDEIAGRRQRSYSQENLAPQNTNADGDQTSEGGMLFDMSNDI